METYHGHVRTPADAIKLFEACRLGSLPRVQRRLSEKERQSIKSGSVFVWDEREAGMRRWTDGKSWSASRVSGSFLTYREMEGKRGGGQFVPAPVRRVAGKTPDSGGSDGDQDMDGEGPDGYRYKPDGLMKQSFSITTSNGQHLHLISYFSRPHAGAPSLAEPTTDPSLRHIVPVKGMYPESTVHEQGPAVTRAPMQQHSSPYMQQSPHQMQHSPHQRGAPPPPYGYQVQQDYAWPPSPISTPPYPHHVASMYNSALPPPSGSANTSPYQHALYHPGGYPQTSMPPQHQQTAFDRPPPPLADSSLPPPPPPPQHRGMSTATTINMMPVYAPNPSPRVAQAQIIAEQQAQMAQRALQSTPMLDPRLVQEGPSLPAVKVSDSSRTSTPQQTNGISSQQNTPTPNGQPPAPNEAKINGNVNGTTSQAQYIPSISALVHATDSISVMSDNKSNSSRAGSRSPRTESQTPKDIPHNKLNNLGEDQRAIRVLDRKFCI